MAIELKIIDNSLPVEQTIARIWKRNVFFIGMYALLMISVFTGAVFNRLYRACLWVKDRFSKNKPIRCRKVYQTQWFEKWLCMITENFWQILWLMLFFTTMFVSKFIYHTAIITWWIARKIVWPLMWFALALLFVLGINNKKDIPQKIY